MSKLICPKCGQEIRPGDAVDTVFPPGREDQRIFTDEDPPIVSHVECPPPEGFVHFDAERADEHREAVAEVLREVYGVDAQHYHTGGGVMAVKVELGSGAFLYVGTESDGERVPQWMGADINRADGECLGTVQLFVRPLGQPDAGTPEEMAAAVAELVEMLK